MLVFHVGRSGWNLREIVFVDFVVLWGWGEGLRSMYDKMIRHESSSAMAYANQNRWFHTEAMHDCNERPGKTWSGKMINFGLLSVPGQIS